MNLNRRTFLKSLGVLAGVAVVSSSGLKLLEAKPNELETGVVRETVAYDILSDQYLARYDCTNGKDCIFVTTQTNITEDFTKHRKQALRILLNEYKKRGWKLKDLKPLPRPLICQLILNY